MLLNLLTNIYPHLQVIEELWTHYLEFHQKDLQQQPATNCTTTVTNAIVPVSSIQAVPVPVVVSTNSSLQQLYATSPAGKFEVRCINWKIWMGISLI